MDKFAMIIFGASGDLTKRKLMPALYSLYRDKRLTGSFTVLGLGGLSILMKITVHIYRESCSSL